MHVPSICTMRHMVQVKRHVENSVDYETRDQACLLHICPMNTHDACQIPVNKGTDNNATYTFIFFKCCFTPTETVRTIRDGEPRTSTSSFTQLPACTSLLYYETRDQAC